jgi:hypothetical protein
VEHFGSAGCRRRGRRGAQPAAADCSGGAGVGQRSNRSAPWARKQGAAHLWRHHALHQLPCCRQAAAACADQLLQRREVHAHAHHSRVVWDDHVCQQLRRLHAGLEPHLGAVGTGAGVGTCP